MNTLESSDAFKKAKMIVFRLLKFRPRSEKEIRDNLAKKKINSRVIDHTVDYFKEIKLINDRDFAKEWIASRLERPFGLNRIQFELKKKGIDKDIRVEELAEAAKTFPEKDVVRALAQNKAGQYKNVDIIKKKQRIYGYLNRRGFNVNIINKVINEL